MKTAEAWAKDIDHGIQHHGLKLTRAIQAIQLDAMKEGMRRASKFVVANEHWNNTSCSLSNSILTAAEQLTEKDL